MKRLGGVVLAGVVIGGCAVELMHYAAKPEDRQEEQPETHGECAGGAALPRSSRGYVMSIGTAHFAVPAGTAM